jgi:hypothetical protein
MIDIALTDQPVNTDNFTAFDKKLPCLFLGFAIKNEYDNKRLKICPSYNPDRKLFVFEQTKTPGYNAIGSDASSTYSVNVMPLYGLFLELNKSGKHLAKTLLNEEVGGNIDIGRYEKIIAEFNFSCSNSYSYLQKRIYPVDINHLKELTDNSLGDDNKVLQHLLEMDDNRFDFQKFGSFKLLILV